MVEPETFTPDMKFEILSDPPCKCEGCDNRQRVVGKLHVQQCQAGGIQV